MLTKEEAATLQSLLMRLGAEAKTRVSNEEWDAVCETFWVVVRLYGTDEEGEDDDDSSDSGS